MLDKFANQLGFQANALVLRAERQRTIASNIANADTPGYAGRDFNFADALRQAGGNGPTLAMATPGGATTPGRAGFIPIAATATASRAGYVAQSQPSMDGNTVDLDRERAAFADNAVRYEATLRFINGQAKTMLTAIQGQ